MTALSQSSSDLVRRWSLLAVTHPLRESGADGGELVDGERALGLCGEVGVFPEIASVRLHGAERVPGQSSGVSRSRAAIDRGSIRLHRPASAARVTDHEVAIGVASAFRISRDVRVVLSTVSSSRTRSGSRLNRCESDAGAAVASRSSSSSPMLGSSAFRAAHRRQVLTRNLQSCLCAMRIVDCHEEGDRDELGDHAPVVSVDGYIGYDDDLPGHLLDWYGNGDVEVLPGVRVSQTSAHYVRPFWEGIGVTVIGRHLFDFVNGWRAGRRPASTSSWCRTGRSPRLRTPRRSITSSTPSRRAVARAKELAGERLVCVTAGEVGGQALAAGLVDEIAMDVAPVVVGTGKRFSGLRGDDAAQRPPCRWWWATRCCTCVTGSKGRPNHRRWLRGVLRDRRVSSRRGRRANEPGRPRRPHWMHG